MSTAARNPADLMFDSWLFAMEAAEVVWWRSWRMMAGGVLADREGWRMVSEKVSAGLTFWPAMMTGGFPATPEALGARMLAHYAAPVRANNRRLAGRRR